MAVSGVFTFGECTLCESELHAQPIHPKPSLDGHIDQSIEHLCEAISMLINYVKGHLAPLTNMSQFSLEKTFSSFLVTYIFKEELNKMKVFRLKCYKVLAQLCRCIYL